MKPGKPLTFATLPRDGGGPPMLVFGLPGNPASAAVTFSLTVGPAIAVLSGRTKEEALPRRVHVTLEEAAPLDPARPEYCRAVARWAAADPGNPAAGGGWRATRTGNQISSRLASARGANALLEISRGSGSIPAGSIVTALLVGDVRGMPVRAEEGYGPTVAPHE